MNLNDELKHGKILSKGKRVSLLTPLCRFDFCQLAEPKEFREGDGKFKFSVDMIFETDPSKPGAVDVKKFLIPALTKLAQENNITVQQITHAKPGIAFGTSQGHPHVLVRIGERFTQAGEPYEGYEKSSLAISASTMPRIQAPPWKPVPCVSPSGEAGFPATEIYNGCWGRAIINPYKPKKWPMVTIGLQGVQMIADGDTLGPGQSDLGALAGVEGAAVQTPLEKAVETAPVENGDFSSFL